MTHEIKRIPQSEAIITVTIAWGEVRPSFEVLLQKTMASVALDGFRPGKVPERLARQKIDRSAVLADAVQKMIQKTFEEIVRKEDLSVVTAPQVQILVLAEGNDIKYEARTVLMPDVQLSVWPKAIAKVNKKHEVGEVVVTDEDVTKEIARIASSRVQLIIVERAAKKEDQVTIDFHMTKDHVPIEGGTSKDHAFILGRGVFIPGFEENIIGMKKGEEKTCALTFPKEYHAKHLAGKDVLCTIILKKVEERKTPTVTDAFARSLGKFADLDALRKSIREGLVKERKQTTVEKKQTEQLDALIDAAKMDIPSVLVEKETQKMLVEFETQITTTGMNMDAYLTQLKKTREDLQKQWETQAEKRVRAALVLAHFAKEHDITVSQEKLEEEMNKMLQHYRNVKNLEKNLDMQQLYHYTKGILQNEAVFAYLEKVQ